MHKYLWLIYYHLYLLISLLSTHCSLDDVAVGAPFYCDYTSDAYDQGRVYVYFQHVKVN